MLPMSPYESPELSSFLFYLTITFWVLATVTNLALTAFFRSHAGAPLTRFITHDIVGANSMFLSRFNDLQKFDGISGYSFAAATVSGVVYFPVMLAVSLYAYLVLIVIPKAFSPPSLTAMKGLGYITVFWGAIIWIMYFYNPWISMEKFPSYSRIFSYPYFCFFGFSGAYALWSISIQICCLFAKILAARVRADG